MILQFWRSQSGSKSRALKFKEIDRFQLSLLCDEYKKHVSSSCNCNFGVFHGVHGGQFACSSTEDLSP